MRERHEVIHSLGRVAILNSFVLAFSNAEELSASLAMREKGMISRVSNAKNYLDDARDSSRALLRLLWPLRRE